MLPYLEGFALMLLPSSWAFYGNHTRMIARKLLLPPSALALPLHHSLPHFIPLHLALPHHTEPQVLWEGGPYSGRAKVLVSGVKNVDG